MLVRRKRRKNQRSQISNSIFIQEIRADTLLHSAYSPNFTQRSPQDPSISERSHARRPKHQLKHSVIPSRKCQASDSTCSSSKSNGKCPTKPPISSVVHRKAIGRWIRLGAKRMDKECGLFNTPRRLLLWLLLVRGRNAWNSIYSFITYS